MPSAIAAGRQLQMLCIRVGRPLRLQLHLPGIDSTVQILCHLNVLANVVEGGAFRQNLVDDESNGRRGKHACRDSQYRECADHPHSAPAERLNTCGTEGETESFHLSLALLTF